MNWGITIRICLACLLGQLANHGLFAQNSNDLDTVTPPFRTTLFSSNTNHNIGCYRIPAITTIPNGDILVAMDERVPSCKDLNGNPDINIVIRTSKDLGNNWSEIRTLIDYPHGESASDPSFIVDKVTGSIFLFFNYMNHNSEPNVYYLKYIKSEDNGSSWSKPVDITNQISKPTWNKDFKFITSGRGIQTRSGDLIHTLVNLDQGMHLFKSLDHGLNWQLVKSKIEPANESKIVELSNGDWMVNSRTNQTGLRWIHISNNEGKSWNSYPDSTLIDPGCNASILRYNFTSEKGRGRLLFSNLKDSKDRKNLHVRISYDDGNTWNEGKEIYFASSAYSTMTVLENGEVGLMYEKNNYSEHEFVRFSIDWLTDGKDEGIK